MKKNETVNIIYQAIYEKFNKGFTAGEDVIHFAQSTLGIETIEDIADIMCGDMDDTGILNLLMVPDLEIRRVVEKSIPPEGMGQDDENLIIVKAVSSIKNTPVVLHGIDSFNVDVPGYIHSEYVKKLMLTKRVPCRDILPVDGKDEEFKRDVLIHLRRFTT